MEQVEVCRTALSECHGCRRVHFLPRAWGQHNKNLKTCNVRRSFETLLSTQRLLKANVRTRTQTRSSDTQKPDSLAVTVFFAGKAQKLVCVISSPKSHTGGTWLLTGSSQVKTPNQLLSLLPTCIFGWFLNSFCHYEYSLAGK
jgi:hypothetical protein